MQREALVVETWSRSWVWCVVWWVKAKGEEEKKRGGGKVAEWREDGWDGMGCFRCDQRDQERAREDGTKGRGEAGGNRTLFSLVTVCLSGARWMDGWMDGWMDALVAAERGGSGGQGEGDGG